MNKKTGLIIVDLLNDFLRQDGTLYCGEEAEKIILKIQKRLSEFRQKNLPVIFLKDSHDKNDPEFEKFPVHCVKGTFGSEIIKEATPLKNEIIIEKTRFSGFFKTDLDKILKKLNLETLYVTGVCTSICVMDTVGGLSNRDYEIIVPENEVADFDREMHEFSLKRMKNLYGAKLV